MNGLIGLLMFLAYLTIGTGFLEVHYRRWQRNRRRGHQ